MALSSLPRIHEHRIRFTGSGREYFRIWIVNLLLIIVTLTLYTPYAKARRLSYMHGHTLVGIHPLGFHGDPRKMLRGYLLVAVLAGLYSVASRLSAIAALVALVAVVVIWPALWRASLQFRLGNTSWRGVRLRFAGSLRGAYGALLPFYLPVIAMLVLGWWMGPDEGEVVKELRDKAALARELSALGAVVLLALMLAPWALAGLKRYQHGNYAYANQVTELRAPVGAFYRLAGKTAGVGVAAFLLLCGLVFGLGVVLGVATSMESLKEAGMGVVPLVIFVLVVAYLVVMAVQMAYFSSRLQNLVWTKTGNPSLRFRSYLPFRSMFWLSVRNWMLTFFTLGLYRPFAVIHMNKLRLESVSLWVKGDVEDWIQTAPYQMNDAAGDMAGDLFGIDMGL